MEELQSTEILDREILEDARKKAHRILKAADEAILQKKAEWGQKLAKDLDELEKKFTQQGNYSTDEIMARLPVDKNRIKTKKIEAMLNSAAAAWYAQMSREYMLDLLTQELEKRLNVCEGIAFPNRMHVFIRHFTQAEAKVIMEKVLPGRNYIIETMYSASAYPEIMVDTPELRIYASIGKIVNNLLSEKRAELVEALGVEA